MEHSDARYPTPQWATEMEQRLSRKIEATGNVVRLLSAQIEELRAVAVRADVQAFKARVEALESKMEWDGK